MNNILKWLILALALCVGCADDGLELPDGPCNEDGETGSFADAETGGSVIGPGDRDILAPSASTPSMSPPPLSVPGWTFDERTNTFLRFASLEEQRRHAWPRRTVLVALPESPFVQPTNDRFELSFPIALEPASTPDDLANHATAITLAFDRVQDLVLGTFIEHRATTTSSSHEVSVPIFSYFTISTSDIAAQKTMRGELLALYPDQQFLMRAWIDGIGLLASGPHGGASLEPAPPSHYYVIRITLLDQDITRSPLEPYACKNGICEDPNNPLDECNDGIDNDGDGHGDLCDWNCLPHTDFGANSFPEATSRVEAGKSYALMGHGSLCTAHPDTWEVELADAALKASELLNSLRPDLDRPIRYRTFSCWVFESEDAYNSYQFGPYEVVEGEPVYSPPICPPGMEDYPYRPTEEDQLHAFDQANLFFEEATLRAWKDFELNIEILGSGGEPANGVVLMTADLRNACKATEFPFCSALGKAYLPDAPVEDRGTAVVGKDLDISTMWTSLAHETGHTVGLVHDDHPNGFMNEFSGTGAGLGTSVDPEYPNVDNNSRWENGLTGSKGENPRSPGFYLTGCEDLADCAPLGKPGWSCTGLYCVEDL